MRCKTVLRFIDDHVDGLLPARRAEKVRRHLDDCESCRAEAEATRAATTPLSAWGDLEPPQGCFESILARIEQLPAEARDRSGLHATRSNVLRGRRVQWMVTGSLAAAAAVLLGLALEAPRTSPMRFGRSPVVNGYAAGFAPLSLVGGAATHADLPFVYTVPSEPTPVFGGGLRTRKVFIEDAAAEPADQMPLPFQEGPR